MGCSPYLAYFTWGHYWQDNHLRQCESCSWSHVLSTCVPFSVCSWEKALIWREKCMHIRHYMMAGVWELMRFPSQKPFLDSSIVSSVSQHVEDTRHFYHLQLFETKTPKEFTCCLWQMARYITDRLGFLADGSSTVGDNRRESGGKNTYRPKNAHFPTVLCSLFFSVYFLACIL